MGGLCQAFHFKSFFEKLFGIGATGFWRLAG
jgi:hypothetical protein